VRSWSVIAFSLVAAAAATAVAATEPPQVDIIASGSPSDLCSTQYAYAVSERLQALVADSGQTPVLKGSDADPLNLSDKSQTVIIAKVSATGTPATAPCFPVPSGYSMQVVVIDRSTNHLGNPIPITLDGRLQSRLITLQEFNSFVAQPATVGSPRSQVDVVILQEATTNDSDTQTANTSFSAPAFLESRLTRDLAVFQYNAMTAADYFKALSASQVQVPTTTEAEKATLCQTNPKLTILRYDLRSSLSTNIWFGAQNGNAVASVRLEPCPEATPFDSISFTYDLKRRYYTTKGSVFPQAILLTNFLVGSGRRDFLVPSFLGSGKVVAASFLSDPDSTATVAAAVGEVSRYVSCRTYVELHQIQFRQTGATIVNDDRERAPCPVANVVSSYLYRYSTRRNGRGIPPPKEALTFPSKDATKQVLGYPATHPEISPGPDPTPIPVPPR